MKIEGLSAYERITQEDLTDIHSKGYILRHKKNRSPGDADRKRG